MDTNSETIESLLARLLDDMEFLGLIKLMPGNKNPAIEGKPQAEDQNNTSKSAVAA
jgi:hypothetical protein